MMHATRLALSLVILAGLAASAPAAIRRTHDLVDVVPHADLIVRGLVDLPARTVTILEVFRGDVVGRRLVVRNLADFGSADWPGAEKRPAEAVLCLDVLDGRVHLVARSSPYWIEPHSAIRYLRPDGRVLAYAQPFNPGGLTLLPEREWTMDSLRKSLTSWLTLPRVSPRARVPLTVDEARRLHAVIDPWIDDHLRRVTAEPSPGQLADLTRALVGLAVTSKGSLRRRALEALLVLARQDGPDRPRRAYVEARLVRLLEALGPEPFHQPIVAEVASEDVFSNKETAAKLARRIGGRTATRAREILSRIEEESADTSLVSRAHFALRDLGR
jgi:hypothetical protein